MTQQSQSQSQQSSYHNVQQQYNELKQSCNVYMNKIVELEMDRNEHQLVEETLITLINDNETNKNRKAYRLVGEVLVERTVDEVLPSVQINRKNMEQTIDALRKQIDESEKKLNEMKIKYNIKDE